MSEEDAGKRLAQAVSDPKLSKSGVYWSWDNDKASLWFSDEQGREGEGTGAHAAPECGPPPSPPLRPACTALLPAHRPPPHSLLPRPGFENQLSEKASDAIKAAKLYEISEKLCGLPPLA